MANARVKTQEIDTEAEALLDKTLADCEQLTGRLKDFLRLADALIAVLPPERRIAYAQRIVRFRTVVRPVRSGATNDNVLAIVSEKEEVTAAEVRDALADKGIPVDHKQINNSLDYLARRGDIRRIAPGRYKYDPAAEALAVEEMLSDSYGPPTHRGHPPSSHLPEDY